MDWIMKIKIKKLKENAVVPGYAHEGDAGMDLFSAEDIVINPGERGIVCTGISVEIPNGYVGLVWDKSGLASKKGIKTMAGVMDSGYRGEWKIVLFNTGSEQHQIKEGDKIAQVLIQPIECAEIEEVKELEDSSRGDGGFGSTGLRKPL